MEIPNKFYRLTAKALVRDADGKLLLLKEEIGVWELPGGSVEFGEDPREAVRRELVEECGFEAATVSEAAKVWTVEQRDKKGGAYWSATVAFEVTLASTNFKPSEEATEFRYFTKEEAAALELDPKVRGGLEIIF